MLKGKISFYPAALAGCLLILVGVFAGPQLIDLLHGNAVTVKHLEAVSLSLYGRFHGHALLTDPYSGEFPTFYNFLSDRIINLLALISGLPAFWTQAVIFVPLLTLLLFLGSYWSVRAIGAERKVALLASILVCASAETPLVHFLYPFLERWSGLPAPTGVLIPPAAAIGVASAQGSGWTIFLPVLAALYIARRPEVTPAVGALRGFFAGAFLGLACLVHTLTFLHLGTICSLYLAVETIVSRARDGRFIDATVRVIAVVFAAVFVAFLSSKNGLSMANFVVFWSACFAISVRDTRSLLFLFSYGLGAVTVASPFLYQIWELSLNVNRFDSYDSPVPKVEFTLFYLAHLLCCLVVLLNARRLGRSDVLIWLVVMLVASLALGYGKIFGFQNHEYRFLTNLIIPLSVLAAFIIAVPPSRSQRFAIYLVLPLLVVGVARNLWAIVTPLPAMVERSVGGFASYSGVISLPPGASALLERVRTETSSSPASRLLLPPEYSYPQQAYRNGLVLAVSQVPGFIADPRFIVWSDLYADRVSVFCSLFPGYAHFDAHTLLHLCEQAPEDLVPGFLTLTKPSASTDVLSLYGIELMALLRGDHDRYLANRAAQLGMTLIHNADGGMLWRNSPMVNPDRLAFGAASYQEPSMLLPVNAPAAGTYLIVLAGRSLSTRVRQFRSTGSNVTSHAFGEDAIVLQVDLPAGPGQLTLDLTPDRRLRTVFPTPIRQILGINKDAIQKYLTGPALASLTE
jgi:hypothetical protein